VALWICLYAASIALAAGTLQPLAEPRHRLLWAVLGPLPLLFLAGVAITHALIGGDNA